MSQLAYIIQIFIGHKEKYISYKINILGIFDLDWVWWQILSKYIIIYLKQRFKVEKENENIEETIVSLKIKIIIIRSINNIKK